MAQLTENKLDKRFDQNIEITGTLTVGEVVVSPSSYLTSIPSEYLTQTEGDARYLQSFTVPSEYLTQTEGDARYLQSFTVPSEYLTQTEGDARYLQSYSESDTLATVTARGDTTSNDIKITDTSSRHYIKISSSVWPELRYTTPSYDETIRLGVAHAADSGYGIDNGDFYIYSASTDDMHLIVPRAAGSSLKTQRNGSTHTIWDSGNDGPGSGLNADLLDGQHASAFLGVSSKAADSNLLDGIDSSEFARVKKGTVTLTQGSYVRVARVDGNALSSAVRMTVNGTTGSVVMNGTFDINVNHYGDIMVYSQCGNYTTIHLQIISNTNEDFDIYLKYTSGSGTACTTYIEIFPLNSETITISPTATAHSGTSYEHIATAGQVKWGQSDGEPPLYANSSRVITAGTIGSQSVSYASNAGTLDGIDSSSFLRSDASDTMNGTLNMANNNITGVNHIVINDAGAGEGIEWGGGNGWKIYESPDNLTNAAGNLQFVTGSTRLVTFNTNGNIYNNGYTHSLAGFSTDSNARHYTWRLDNIGNNSGWWKIARVQAGQSSRLRIELIGHNSYSGGQDGGRTIIIAQINNNNDLEGSWYTEGGYTDGILGLNFEDLGAGDFNINVNIGSYAEYAIDAILSDGTLTVYDVEVSAKTANVSEVYNMRSSTNFHDNVNVNGSVTADSLRVDKSYVFNTSTFTVDMYVDTAGGWARSFRIYNANDNSATAAFGNYNEYSYWHIGDPDSLDVTLYNGNGIRLFSNANVYMSNYLGIGTQTAQKPLHVATGTALFNVSDDWQQSSYGTTLFRGGNFESSISNNTNTLKIFPATSSRAVGNYWGGIEFMHLDPENSSWGTSYTGAQMWIGGRIVDQPGQERSAFVIATNNSTTAGTHPTERFTVLPDGKIGINKTNPGYTLDIGGNPRIYSPSTPTLRLETTQDPNYRAEIQARYNWSEPFWITAYYGSKVISTANGSNILHLYTDGSPRATLKGSSFGVGTQSPAAKIHSASSYFFVGGSDGMLKMKSVATTYGSETVVLQTTIDNRTDDYTVSTYGGDGRHFLVFQPDGGRVGVRNIQPAYELDVNGTIRASGDIIAYSDARVKENIKTIDNALDKVNALRGVEYNKIGDNNKSIGVIAQEVQKVLPEVVKIDDKDMMSVAYGNMVGVLVEAIKELSNKVEELENKLNGTK